MAPMRAEALPLQLAARHVKLAGSFSVVWRRFLEEGDVVGEHEVYAGLGPEQVK
jgi:hypothetical protein